MNYKDIEKEFDKKELKEFEKFCKSYCEYHKVGKIETLRICGNLEQVVKRILKANVKTKINLVIDDMIGEENPYIEGEREWEGYNQKISELKEYKEKFNK